MVKHFGAEPAFSLIHQKTAASVAIEAFSGAEIALLKKEKICEPEGFFNIFQKLFF